MDFADARRRMVDGQLRPNKVTDPHLLDVLRDLPREAFLPRAVQSRAYADEDVPLPAGRALLAPMTLARLLQLAELRPADRVLVLGAGVGYGTAAVARLGARPVAVESEPALIALARAAWAALLPAGAVRLEVADPTAGCAAGAPFDVIIIEGEVPEIPPVVLGQLAEGGRLVAILGEGRRAGRAVLARNLGGARSVTTAFDCPAAALPAFAKSPGFVF